MWKTFSDFIFMPKNVYIFVSNKHAAHTQNSRHIHVHTQQTHTHTHTHSHNIQRHTLNYVNK